MNDCACEAMIDTPNPNDILQTLAQPVLCIDKETIILQTNTAAQMLLNSSDTALHGKKLSDLLLHDSPLLALVWDASAAQSSYAAHAIELSFNPLHHHNHSLQNQLYDVQVLPMADYNGCMVIHIQPRSIANIMNRQLTHQGAVRAVVGASALLAHEIKNPLSGIRGAAQLLEPELEPNNRDLTRMICKEVDRIAALVDRMETFTDTRPTQRKPENIHEILSHVLQLARSGFAKNVRLIERYDPSLPLVLVNHDALVQVFLNLVKNAMEAVQDQSGEIMFTTAFRHGVRMTSPGSKKPMSLPIEICIIDNGAGVQGDIQDFMFEPFVTSKTNGSGLGLALAAKIIGDHGGVIDHSRDDRHTVMRVLLPAQQA